MSLEEFIQKAVDLIRTKYPNFMDSDYKWKQITGEYGYEAVIAKKKQESEKHTSGLYHAIAIDGIISVAKYTVDSVFDIEDDETKKLTL